MVETDAKHERFTAPDTFEELMELWDTEPYSRVSSNEVYKVGEGDGTKEERDRVKAEFVKGEIENPVVSYPNLDAEALTEGRESMLALYERATNLPDGIDKDLALQIMRKKIMELDRHLEV